jgi:hypothetical protein
MGPRAATLLAACALALGLPPSSQAACPRLIMGSGPPLAELIVISDWGVACELYASFFAGAPVDVRLEGRPSIRLGLFWGQIWEPYVRGGRLGELKPGQANQVGRFYPAVGGEPALVAVPGYGDWPKAVNEDGLRILEGRGIAVRLDEGEAAGEPWIKIGLIGGVILALPLLLLARRSRHRRVPPHRLAVWRLRSRA